MSAPPVGAGVIGLGFGAKVHVPGLRRIPRVSVVAVSARSGAAAAAEQLEVARAYDDWHDLIADEGVHLVSIATPPATHREIAVDALAAGKAVLCEKPLGVTVADAEEMVVAARVAGVPTLVDFEFRAVPAFARAAELLGEGAIGEIRHAEVRWTLASRRGPLPPSWKDERRLGGGTLLSLGVHSFDYLEWYLGPIARIRGTLEHGAGPNSDTGCDAHLDLASGATARIVLSAAAEHPEGHVVAFEGDDGTLVLENRELIDYMRSFRLRLVGKRAETLEPEPSDQDGRLAPFSALSARLVDAIRTGGPCDPSFEEGVRAQRIAGAIEESNRTGEWVSVTTPEEPETQV